MTWLGYFGSFDPNENAPGMSHSVVAATVVAPARQIARNVCACNWKKFAIGGVTFAQATTSSRAGNRF